MPSVSQELAATLERLDPDRAKYLENLVRDAMALAQATSIPRSADSAWPAGYFDATAGAFAGEMFERPPQGELAQRETW